MPWKFLEKIIYHGKMRDSSLNGPENTIINTTDSSLYEIKIKSIKNITIKNKENGK